MSDTTGPTCGPWRVDDRRHAPLKNIRIVGADGHQVGEVSDVHTRDYLHSGWTNEQADAVDALGLANANLMAAAPDLLFACRAAFPWIASQIEYTGCSVKDPCERVAELLCEAIKKAEGCTTRTAKNQGWIALDPGCNYCGICPDCVKEAGK